MSWHFAADAKIIDGPHQSLAKMMLPEAIDHHSREQASGSVIDIGHPLGHCPSLRTFRNSSSLSFSRPFFSSFTQSSSFFRDVFTRSFQADSCSLYFARSSRLISRTSSRDVVVNAHWMR